MNLKEIILLLLIGSFAGFVSGGFGVGGGIVIVPALVFIMGYPQYKAQGTSVTLMLPPIFIVAAYNFYEEGFVDVPVALMLMFSFVIGGYFGARIALKLPEFTVKKVFGAFMILAGIKMVIG